MRNTSPPDKAADPRDKAANPIREDFSLGDYLRFHAREKLPLPLYHALRAVYRSAKKLLGKETPAAEETKPAAPRPDFVDIAQAPPVVAPETPRVIPFYLPQFHTFPENDAWWGRGFTEWSNVARGVPFFPGHYQPQIPIDVGFYDLRVPEVMERQIELAKLYGIYGFCFHYYWFSGKRLMERPLFDFLKRPELDIPFSLCWANEPWSRRWDGSEHEVLMEQKLLPGDPERFMDDLLPFVSDSRYMTIDGKPLVIIYRPNLWTREQVLDLTHRMRERAIKEYRLKGLYLVCALSFGFTDDPRDWGFDAAVEFPPHFYRRRGPRLNLDNPDFRGVICDMRDIVSQQKALPPSPYPRFKTAFPAWDNTARRMERAMIFHHSSPALYGEWLEDCLQYVYAHNRPEERLVFVHAWNEWAEGAHLEPDTRYGYAHLQATADALANFKPR